MHREFIKKQTFLPLGRIWKWIIKWYDGMQQMRPRQIKQQIKVHRYIVASAGTA
jgi:hypothetical protein